MLEETDQMKDMRLHMDLLHSFLALLLNFTVILYIYQASMRA